MKVRSLLLLSTCLLLAGTLGPACSSGSEIDGVGGGDAGATSSGGTAGSGSTSGSGSGQGSGGRTSGGAANGSGSTTASGAATGAGGAGSGASGNLGGLAGAGAGSGADPSCDQAGLAALGESCTSTADCCTGLCGASGTCVSDVGACGADGAACSNGTQCCSFSCQNETCSADACTEDGAECSADSECCSGACQDDGTCFDLNDLSDFVFPPEAKKESMDPTCRTSGNPCAQDLDCCSGLCGDDGVCSRGSSFCVQAFDICSSNSDCCQGVCGKQEGATVGVCLNRAGAGTRCDNMLLAGEVCGGDCSLCCSRSCAPFGASGTFVCQPPRGCRPEGELCEEDLDCCGGDPDFTAAGNQSGFCEKEPGASVGRCAKTGCTPHGAICGYDNLGETSCDKNISAPQGTSCCQPMGSKQNLCGVDSLLIPRCNALSECVQAGEACGTADDCCGGLPCVQAGASGGFVCYDPPGDEACVDHGGPCTADADCCVGTSCQLTPGAGTGTCGSVTSPPGGTGGSGAGGNSGAGGTSGSGSSSGSGGSTAACAFYGQGCEQDSDCCNGVPCDSSANPSICRFSGGG